MEKEEYEGVARMNFNLPRKMYTRMMDLAGNVLGIESAGGAAKYFCMIGFQQSLASLLVAKNAESGKQANDAVVQMNDMFIKMAQAEASADASSILDTMGITPDRKTQQNSGSARNEQKKGHRMK